MTEPPPPIIHIQSLRSDIPGRDAPIEIQWGSWSCHASVEAVRETAEDLFTCAAWADAMEALLRLNLDAELIAGFISLALQDRDKRYFGHRDTLMLMPGASTFRKAGAVIIQHNHTKASVDPDEARVMGRNWLEVAEASESDSLVDEALTHFGLLNQTERNRVFDYMRAARDK